MSYNRVVKSKLSFKGSSTTTGTKRKATNSFSDETAAVHSTTSSGSAEKPSITIESGVGRITSSGTTVFGHETKFMDQLSPGDAILIKHPTSFKDETKIVKMVLSNISIGISSGFSSDIISTTSFQFIKAPKELTINPEDEVRNTKQKKQDEEVAAFGTYASKGGEEIVYRVKKPGSFGGYAILKESSAEGSMTREELLNFRSKKKADRLAI
jgi:hypothetical protein